MRPAIPASIGVSAVLIGLAVFFGSSETAVAQDSLVPCGNSPDNLCNACDLVQLGENLVNFLLGLAGSVAAVMFAWAGFLYITASGSMEQVKKAHTIFQNVLIGLLIALAAWLVVKTVMTSLVNDEFIPKWNAIQCEAPR